MKLFTFSGINGRFFGENEGKGIVDFAHKLSKSAASQSSPLTIDYVGESGVDHFVSNVNLGGIFSDPTSLFTLSASNELDIEASLFAPIYGRKILESLTGDTDPVLVLAHSQGTNIFAFTWRWLLEHHSATLTNRRTRIILFDPKVGVTHIQDLLGLDRDREFLDFLFFQSENDPLGNQTLGIGGKFIDHYEIGDHLWVRELDHGSIVDWKSLQKNLTVLTLPEYVPFRHAWRKAAIHTHRGGRRTKNPAAQRAKAIRKVLSGLDLPKRKPSEAVLAFLSGHLPAKFTS